MNTFGEKLKARLAEQNMTQLELSRRTGITPASVSKYIHNERFPNLKTASKIAEVLDVPLEWFREE